MNQEEANKALLNARTVEETKAALAAGADVNARDVHRRTALTYAKTAEQTKLLLDAGADVNLGIYCDEESLWHEGPSALLYAKTPGQTRLLLEAGAWTDVRSGWGDDESLLMSAKTAVETKLYLDAGANVNDTNFNCDTALMFAVRRGNIRQIKLLLAAGADINAKNRDGKTAFDFAETKEQKEILANAMKKRGIEKHKENFHHSQKARKEILKRQPEEKVSGVALADEIAKDKISGKEKRTITPEVGREIRRRKAMER